MNMGVFARIQVDDVFCKLRGPLMTGKDIITSLGRSDEPRQICVLPFTIRIHHQFMNMAVTSNIDN